MKLEIVTSEDAAHLHFSNQVRKPDLCREKAMETVVCGSKRNIFFPQKENLIYLSSFRQISM